MTVSTLSFTPVTNTTSSLKSVKSAAFLPTVKILHRITWNLCFYMHILFSTNATDRKQWRCTTKIHACVHLVMLMHGLFTQDSSSLCHVTCRLSRWVLLKTSFVQSPCRFTILHFHNHLAFWLWGVSAFDHKCNRLNPLIKSQWAWSIRQFSQIHESTIAY